MATIQNLMQNLGSNRDDIRSKLIEMGIAVDANAKLSEVAEAAQAIIVDKDTTQITLGRGNAVTLMPGTYYKNEVNVVLNANNKHYSGEEEIPVVDEVNLTYTVSPNATQNGDMSVYPISAEPVVINAPEGFKCMFVETTTRPIAGANVNAVISEDGRTITFTMTGSAMKPGTGVPETKAVKYSCVYKSTEFHNGTPVIPTTEAQHFYANNEEVMTAFTVAAIPIDDSVTAEINDVITKASGADEYYEATTVDGEYMTRARVKKVVIDSTSVDSTDLYNGTTDALVIKASDLSYNGLDEVTIPRPELAAVPTTVDLLSLGAENGSVTVSTGYVSGDKAIVIESAELYAELAAI